MNKVLFSFVWVFFLPAMLSAQQAPDYESWIGGYVQYYSADSDKLPPIGGLEAGLSYGAELGFRFDDSWAIRFEASRLFLSADDNIELAEDNNGTFIGGDALYFLPDDIAYVFTGVRQQSLESDNFRMMSLGVGKHWKVSTNLRLITEATTYYDFGHQFQENSLKLGLAYVFGAKVLPARPDSDGDGFYDSVDRCPYTLPGVQVDNTGCDLDMDKDGIINTYDECPLTPLGTTVKPNGCQYGDADNDGIIDNVDSCPNTPINSNVNKFGCSIIVDSDSDGVPNDRDACTSIKHTKTVDETGCPTYLEQKGGEVIINILFPINSSMVSSYYHQRLMELATILNRNNNLIAILEGHSSAIGDSDYNQNLSEQRAKAVYRMLTQIYEVDEAQIESVGYGENRLIDTTFTDEAHKINQRTEVKVMLVTTL